MKKKMCLLRMKLMYSLLYQPGRGRGEESRVRGGERGRAKQDTHTNTHTRSHTHTHTHTHKHTCAAVEGEAIGGVELLDEELRENDLICPQRVIAVLPVEHEVILIVGI